MTVDWQNAKCEEIKCKVVNSVNYVPLTEPSIKICKPTRFVKIDPDGNCLFRALSVVLTGSPESHIYLRMVLCRHISSDKEKYSKGILEAATVEEYIKTMIRPCNDPLDTEKWGSHIELIIFADILGTDIFTYMSVNHEWKRFKTKNPDLTTPYCALYLRNKGCHYDVVTRCKR